MGDVRCRFFWGVTFFQGEGGRGGSVYLERKSLFIDVSIYLCIIDF